MTGSRSFLIKWTAVVLGLACGSSIARAQLRIRSGIGYRWNFSRRLETLYVWNLQRTGAGDLDLWSQAINLRIFLQL